MRTFSSIVLPRLLSLVLPLSLLVSAESADAGKKEWKAEVKQGQITVREGRRQICVIKTEQPDVQKTHFLKWQGKKCLAVKSRQPQGPALLQLFDAHSGKLIDKVLANAVANGQPAWAATWKE